MKQKLTTIERRAKAACDEISQRVPDSPFHFAMMWKESSCYGLCPSIAYRCEKAAYAGGCGYCKESACLAEFLRFLVPGIDLGHGAGFSTVRDNLAKAGYRLVHEYNGRREDGYSICRIA